jgi:hypothetical protein
MAPNLLRGDELDDLIRDAQADFVSLFTPEEQAIQNYSALSRREKAVLGPIVAQVGATVEMEISRIRYKIKAALVKNSTLNELFQADLYLSSRHEFMFYSCARRYFEGLFGTGLVPVVVEEGKEEPPLASHIYFHRKVRGVQFGRRIVITGPSDESGTFPVYTYHAKTHQAGLLDPSSTSGKSSRVQSVRWEEMLAYKILELMRIGPEARFFGLDPKNFYVATRDIKEEIMSVMSRMPGSMPGSADEEGNEEEDGFKKLPPLTRDEVQLLPTLNLPQYQKELVEIDILVRILGLTDALSNNGNVFFLLPDGCNVVGSRIVDFCLNRKDDPELYSMNVFNSFEKGNGSSQYNRCPSLFVQGILVENPEMRIRMAMEVMNPEWMEKLDRAMTEAEALVNTIIPRFSLISSISSSPSSSSSSSFPSESSPVDDFNEYVKFVRTNLDNFCEGLKAYFASKRKAEEDKDC